MKLSEFKSHLKGMQSLSFIQPSGSPVPAHFHITEAGVTTKHFIDCGGTVREEKVINFQLWEANDFDHRLAPQKLINIIELSEKVLNLPNLDIEVEYQSDTIGKFGLEFNGTHFMLTSKQTACLAEDKCGIPQEKVKVNLKDLSTERSASCTPGGKCC
jgi:hypothetical protein